MQNLKTIEDELVLTKTVKALVQSYEEIAIMRMQKIRASVESTRKFIEKVYPIFVEVKAVYRASVIRALNKSEDERYVFSTLNKNGRSVYILLTPNDRLVGDIGQKVYREYVKAIENVNGDLIVIGRLGRKLMNQSFRGYKFRYYDMPGPRENKQILEIVDFILNYQNVELFYGKFQNLLNQIGFHDNLTGDSLVGGGEQVVPKHRYLFEPSIERVLNFFEVQIFISLFKQKLAESELAKLGSRITAMEAATKNTETNMARLEKERRNLMHQIDNKKQLERLSGISLWG